MNRPLRVRHRRTFALLLGLVPIGFAAALTVRASVPEMDRIPHPTPTSRAFPEGQDQPLDSDEWSAHFDARIRPADGGRVLLELQPLEDWMRPDLLVYWSATETETPGAASVLVGKLAGTQRRRFELPSAQPGWITVFSLGHQETVFHAPVAVEPLQSQY